MDKAKDIPSTADDITTDNKSQDFSINLDTFKPYLSQTVLDTIKILLENETFYGEITQKDNNAILEVYNCSAYTLTLTLENVTGIPKHYDCLWFPSESLIMKDDGSFCLTGDYEIWDVKASASDDISDNTSDDEFDKFSISFTGAKTDIQIFNAAKQSFISSPWLYLLSIASEILNKYFLPGVHLNDREKTLLPLLGEICQLAYWSFIPKEYQNLEFPIFKQYIDSFGYKELIAPLDNIAKNYDTHKKMQLTKDKYIDMLNKSKYEPLWRMIYHLIADSQSQYMSRADYEFSSEEYNNIRNKIQCYMKKCGYTGTYPDFVKHGNITGCHLAQSYDKSYFISHEKNVVFHIHCIEDVFNLHMYIQFLCGTEILHANESTSDIFRCTFNSKGRTFFDIVSYEHNFLTEDNKISSHNLDLRMLIATKKAELKKLTKDEQKELKNDDFSKLKIFLLVVLFFGGLFGIFTTVGFMIVAILFELFLGQHDTSLSMLLDFPWWKMLLFSWISFGGIMGCITVLFKRK